MNTNDLIAEAKKIGFTYHGKTENGHLLFLSDDGERVITSGTASDWRSHKNALSRMERISGKKREKPRKKKDASGLLDVITPQVQVERSKRIDEMIEEYKTLVLELRITTLQNQDPSQDINRVVEIGQRLAVIGQLLKELHVPIPEHDAPIDAPQEMRRASP